MTKWILILLCTYALTGCGGGGSGSSSSMEWASVTGLWSGTVVSDNSQVTHVFGVASANNELRLISDDLSLQYAGTVSISGNSGTGTLRGYAVDGVFYNGQPVTTFSITFTVVENQSITGTYTTEGDSGRFTLTYEPGAERQSSLLDLSGEWGYSSMGQWAHAVISNDGELQATFDSGCEVNGTVTLPSYDWAIYRASVSVTSCAELDGSYTGLMFLDAESYEEDILWLMLSNNSFSYMDGFIRLP